MKLLANSFRLLAVGIFGYFLYELFLLIQFVVGEDDVPNYWDAISNLGLRIWQPLCLSIMTFATSVTFNRKFADLTKKTSSKFAYFFINLLMIFGYFLLAMGFAINRDTGDIVWPFFIIWLFLTGFPGISRSRKVIQVKEDDAAAQKKKAKEKKEKELLEREKQLSELKEKKLKALNDNLAKTKAEEENIDKKIEKLKKTIEEEKETIRALEQKYPFIHTIVANR
jgi:hypothetical protein